MCCPIQPLTDHKVFVNPRLIVNIAVFLELSSVVEPGPRGAATSPCLIDGGAVLK